MSLLQEPGYGHGDYVAGLTQPAKREGCKKLIAQADGPARPPSALCIWPDVLMFLDPRAQEPGGIFYYPVQDILHSTGCVCKCVCVCVGALSKLRKFMAA